MKLIKILILLGVWLSTPSFALVATHAATSTVITTAAVASATSARRRRAASDASIAGLDTYNCYFHERSIDDEEDRDDKYKYCEKRVKYFCSKCVLGKQRGVTETTSGVIVTFDIIDLGELEHDFHEDTSNLTR